MGFDDSVEAAAALRWAVRHAADHQEIRVVHVYDHVAPLGRSAAYRRTREGLTRARATRWLEIALESFRQRTQPPVRLEVVEGSPARVLEYRSRTAALLVLGVSRTGVRRLVRGSVGRHCLGRSSCPVVIVPTDASPTRSAHERVTGSGLDETASA